MLWHVGNTTVRTPYRLKEALEVLYSSPLNGNIDGKESEQKFLQLLNDNEIVDSKHADDIVKASFHGRKWRSALYQLGFITPKAIKDLDTKEKVELDTIVTQSEGLTGRFYEVTPNGSRLINSERLPAQQECFLRALANYKIASPIEPDYKCKPFSPLRFILKIISGLEIAGSEHRLSFNEFALFVQTSTPEHGVDKIIEKILTFRKGKLAAKGKVRAFYRNLYTTVANEVDRKPDTLTDYADLSFRYLKATGLFRSAGRGIAINPAKSQLAILLREQPLPTYTTEEYLNSLWRGADLPSDNESEAYVILQDLLTILTARGLTPAIKFPAATADIRDLNEARFALEEQISRLEETDYAADQANKIDEILAWMSAIPKRGSAKLANGETVRIPQGEGPAYLEWIVWRAFLAINSLTNEPWDARRFQIDQDFLPIHCAPGGGPDMIFEFEDMVVVVEVTLTASSRQEAAEGEPVRRHVAQIAESSEKDVYGLFIALNIDSNTAHTFKYGDWYKKDDTKMALDIVPITLSDFAAFLKTGENKLDQLPKSLLDLMIKCRAKINLDAPQWKKAVSDIFQKAG